MKGIKGFQINSYSFNSPLFLYLFESTHLEHVNLLLGKMTPTATS